MTSVMSEAIRQMMDQDRDAEKAKRRFLERIRHAPGRGTRGKIPWTRDELYERRPDLPKAAK